jgi:hypothetical protein
MAVEHGAGLRHHGLRRPGLLAGPAGDGAGRHVGDPDWEEDIRRLACMSREFADLWARHDVADPEPRTLTYPHPQAGALRLAASELDVPDLPEARIVVYTPRDDETRARLPLTRRAPASAQVIG